MNGIVVGKRVGVGAAITSTCAVFAHIWPQHAPAMISAAVPITFVVQLLIVKKFGVTGKK
jgi:hypothetical protein